MKKTIENILRVLWYIIWIIICLCYLPIFILAALLGSAWGGITNSFYLGEMVIAEITEYLFRKMGKQYEM